MIAAFDFVPWVVLGAVIALVDATQDCEPGGELLLVKQVGGELVLTTGPHLVAIADAGLAHMHGFGPRAYEQPRFAGAREITFG